MLRSRIIRAIVVFYLIVSLPISIIFFKYEYIRFQVFNSASQKIAQIMKPDIIFVGDSLMAGGRNWFRLLGLDAFRSINFAQSGATTFQIEKQIERALTFKPKYIIINGGTNDLLGPYDFDIGEVLNEFKRILKMFEKTSVTPIVTLVPYTNDININHEIEHLNEAITLLALENDVHTIDLNLNIAPSGLILPEFTTDGIHLSSSAYDIWAMGIKKYISGHD